MIISECQVGYYPDCGVSYYFSRLRKNIGIYLGLTGTAISGKEAYSLGLADYFVPSEKLKELEEECLRVVDVDISVEKLKKIVEKYSENTKEPFENEDEIESIFGKNTLKEVFQELERRSASSAFAKKTLGKLNKCSPKSLRIAFEQHQRAKKMDINQVLEMDYALIK